MMENPNENFYKTSDLALVVTISLFFPIDSVDKTSTRVFFLFRHCKELDDLVESFWRGDLRVEPQRYFAQLKVIKTRIYSDA